MKIICAALAALCLAACHPQSVGGVKPIDWDSFGHPDMSDSLDQKVASLSRNALRYVLNHEILVLPLDAQGLYDFSGVDEKMIRPPAQTATALGIALKTGLFDADGIGLPLAEAEDIQVRLVRSLASAHLANTPAGWGDAWQSAHWAFFAGFGAFLAWDLLDGETRDQVVAMIHHEADRFDKDPPYSNDDRSDTKAEENAWNAGILVLAQAMMGDHENALRWRTRASQWLVSAYSRPSDLQRDTIIDGRQVAEWLGGYNMFEDGYVYNHDLMHPDYIAAIEILLWNPLVLSLSRQMVPQATFWNTEIAYGCLVDHLWDSPPYEPPGGTIYRDGQATVYYPQGTDWSSMRVDNFFIVDLLMSILKRDGSVSTPGRTWAGLRADHLLWMQSRSATGQLFIESDNLRFVPKESFAAFHFTFAYLGLWLEAQDAIASTGNWLDD